VSTRDFALTGPYTPPGSSSTNFELGGPVDQTVGPGVSAGDQAQFGSPTLVKESTLQNVSAGDQAQFGAPTLVWDQFIRPDGYNATQFGGPTVAGLRYILPGGYDATQFGTATVYNFNQYVQMQGFDSAMVWDDYGPVDCINPVRGGAKMYLHTGNFIVGAGDMSSFGQPTVSHV
jgi:hypothetical protein